MTKEYSVQAASGKVDISTSAYEDLNKATHQKIEIRPGLEEIPLSKWIEGILHIVIERPFLQYHPTLVERHTQSIPAEHRTPQKRNHNRFQQHRPQLLPPYPALFLQRITITQSLDVLRHSCQGEDDLGQSEGKAGIAMHVKR